ncbi:hypothetical protein NQ315_006499 [Exocentrus adspersus]|uniref:TIL domain-containing protein n=1 Tax=Exocentrus adspersus TaxID=1586481 RepID=A0AAV8W0F8_9CUCU|nr:hypothetical protein NQ315_006499 [Exocentrus adspersus]
MKCFALVVVLLSLLFAVATAAQCNGRNERYYECKPCAAVNCGETDPDFCTAACQNPGCYCERNHYRKNGACVPRNQCTRSVSSATCNNMKCFILVAVLLSIMFAVTNAAQCSGQNEKYYECQPCAAVNCGEKNPDACITVCQNPGCYCEQNHYRKNGVCVPKSEC